MACPRLETVEIDEYKIYYLGTSHDRYEDTGFGFIVSKQLIKIVTNFKTISEKVMIIRVET